MFGAALTDARIVSLPTLTPIVVAVTYDPVADFAPVAQGANFQFALSVVTNHPAKTIGEIVT